MKNNFFAIIFTCLHSYFAIGQCPVADFSIINSNKLCTNSSVILDNNSTNGVSFQWDFCPEDFTETFANNSVVASGVAGGHGYKLIEDNGIWYGFMTLRTADRIIRLDFGTSPESTPSLVDLGSFGLLDAPEGIAFYKEGDNWFAFIGKGENSAGQVVRLAFGNNLSNSPIATGFGTFGLGSVRIRDVNIVRQGSDIILLLLVYNSSSISRINFGTSLLNVPSSPNTLGIAGASLPRGFSVVRSCDSWIFHVISENGLVQQITFGANVLGPLTVSGGYTFTSVVQPWRIKTIYSGNNYYSIISNNARAYSIINFGNLTSSTPTEILSTNDIRFTGIDVVNYRGSIKIQGFASANLVTTVNYSKSCGFTNDFSFLESPDPLKLIEGSYKIDLGVMDGYGRKSYKSLSFTVNNDIAPEISIGFDSNCTDAEVHFNLQSTSNLVSWNWDLGNNTSSNLENPVELYSIPNSYAIIVDVEDIQGCVNRTVRTLNIYHPPAASFIIPPDLICTNNEFTFTNNTTDNFDGNLAYEWLVNGALESTARNFKYTFSTEGDQQVKLITSIPGCSSEMTQLISNVQTGPIVDFDYTGKCEDGEILFTNQSSGSINAFDWDFENSNTSTEENPAVIFSDYGDYNVSLSAFAPNGCVSTIKKPVTIYSVPQTNFTIDLPPFACAGTPSQFNDLTPPMPDSNITSWQWSFGDPSNVSSSQRNPSFTYPLAGNYDVSLTTTSNYGCSNSFQKMVTIFPSPQADFSFGTACVNQETQFTDLSTGDIKSWLWSMQGNTYSEQNPKHKFLSASTHAALLTVTGSNNCISQATKNVFVPIPIIADFTSTTTCATKPTLFDEINKGGTDPAVSWTWNFAGQGSGSGSPAQHVFSSIGNYSVTMNTTRQSGCTYSVTKTIPIVEPPIAQFTTSREAGGAPLKVDFTNTSLNATNYYWKFGDATHTTSAQFSPSFTYIDLGEYNAELTAINASLHCEDSYSQMITVVIPRINAAMYDFRLGEIPGSDNLSPVITIENKSNVDLMNTEVYLDLSGSSLIHEDIGAVIKPNESYAYSFTQSIAPRTLSYVCAEVKVSGDEYAFDNRQCINLLDEYVSQVPYPNPASSELMLEWINVVDEPMHLVIYNASGQSIISRQYSPTLKGLNQVKLDVSGLSAGIYFVSYVVNGQTQNFKFSIIR